jgi:hypothetical protein
MAIVPLALLGATIYSLINFFKLITNKDWNGSVTMLVTWLAGIIGVFIVAASALGKGISINGTDLTAIDIWSKIILGIEATSLFAVVPYKVIAAIAKQGVKEPPLFSPHAPINPNAQ